MKKIIILSSIASSLFVSACSSTKKEANEQSFKFDTTNVKSGEVFYQCPMHPNVLSGKAADCPECGMALEKQTKY